MITTVTGAITTEQLGFTQMHEHLFVSQGPATQKNPALLIDNEDLSAAELISYREAGGNSILDAQPGGAGRNAAVLKRISLRSGIRIITVTGFHLPLFYPKDHWIHSWDKAQLYGHFCRELLQGVAEAPGIKAGAVKAAIGADGLTAPTAVKLRAAARAAADTGVPLVLHTEKGLAAPDALHLCGQVGLSPGHVLVCHADRNADNYPLHEEIAGTGAMLEYDTIGRFQYHDDEAECRLIAHMLGKGYQEQLLLSLDTTAQRLASYGGSIGLTYLLLVFLPLLRRFGIPDPAIRTITLANPRRVFM